MPKKTVKKKKIKILMFSAGMISGAFRMMMDISENINQENYEIFVSYKPEYADWGKYEIDSIINARAKLIPLRGKKLFDVRGFFDLWKTIQKEQIDILHCWDVLGVPGRIIGRLAGSKIVEEFANPPPAINTEISLKHYLVNKITSLLVHGYVACSNEIMKKYLKKKPVFFKNKIQSVVCNCIKIPDLDITAENISRIRAEYNLPDKELIITNIGYFNEQKAQRDLLHAFRKVVDQREDVQLVIVGWGRLEDKLKKQVRDLRLQNKVLFTGKLPRPKVFEILSITDLFVLSSHWEGFGIVLAEAMAAGKPVISTDTDGGREVVEDGISGIIVPPKQPQALSRAVLQLLENPELMEKMGERGLKRVKKYFNCEQYTKGYEEFYGSVLEL
jgi:glycosyltransferase involved in cell wall biosynthesis